jgi:iron-sulfur cluster assembly accessory protein
MIVLTDMAATKVRELLAEENDDKLMLRVSVRPGGCAGFSYDMFFDSKFEENDNVEEYEGFKVVSDPSSSVLLKDATLDYKGGLESGFVIKNPNAQRTCGCGSSFS